MGDLPLKLPLPLSPSPSPSPPPPLPPPAVSLRGMPARPDPLRKRPRPAAPANPPVTTLPSTLTEPAPSTDLPFATTRTSRPENLTTSVALPPRCPTAAVARVFLRTVTYVVYDRLSSHAPHKEAARVAKALVELLVDERFPPPHRASMPLARKCAEFLLAPAASSLVWFVVHRLRPARHIHSGAAPAPLATAALCTVAHRTARQALIYRLFFRIGTLYYSLASALGIVCCFFNDSIFPDLLHLERWSNHFSSSQGTAAILRSLVYALAFSLPLQHLSKLLRDSPRRRGNVKKIIFAIALSKIQKVLRLAKSLSSLQSWAV